MRWLNDYLIRNIKKPAVILHNRFLTILSVILLVLSSGCLSYYDITPINQAAWNNDVEGMKALLDKGVSIDEVGTRPNQNGDPNDGIPMATPLEAAIVQGNIEATKFIIESGADVNLIRRCWIDTPNGRYVFDGSALMLACLKGDLQIVNMLLDAGADVHQLTRESAFTPGFMDSYDALQFSAEMGNVEIAELLIKHGADVNAKDKSGGKAAHTAFSKGYYNYVITLIENGLEIESDATWNHYDAEIAHLAAIYYVPVDDDKALQLFKKAIELYPEGAENYNLIASKRPMEELSPRFVSVLLDKKLEVPLEDGWALKIERIILSIKIGPMTASFEEYVSATNEYANTTIVPESFPFLSVSDKPGRYSMAPSIFFENFITYNQNWTKKEFFIIKALQSFKNQNDCQEIVTCFEQNNSSTSLVECVKKTYEVGP